MNNKTLLIGALAATLVTVGVFLSLSTTGPRPQPSTATIPAPVGHVNDFANLIDDAEEQKLEAELAAAPHEIAVLTVDTTSPYTIEAYGIKVADQWKAGDTARDDGIIFIIAKNDRKARIEVGSGAEAYITDSRAGAILDDHVIPQFKSSNYTAGIVQGVHAILSSF